MFKRYELMDTVGKFMNEKNEEAYDDAYVDIENRLIQIDDENVKIIRINEIYKKENTRHESINRFFQIFVVIDDEEEEFFIRVMQNE